MRHRREEPSREFILSYLDYNPLAGKFKWLKTRNRIAEKGSVAGYLKPDGYVQIILCGRAFLLTDWHGYVFMAHQQVRWLITSMAFAMTTGRAI